MRIATYNVWNSPRGMPERMAGIVEQILACGADVVCLQEVTEPMWSALRALEAYPHAQWFAYGGESGPDAEGLAMLSRLEMRDAEFLNAHARHRNSRALCATVQCGGAQLCIANVHLPSGSLAERERQIVAVDAYLRGRRADYHLLAGDFNCGEHASVHRFLLGEQTLEGAETLWYDLAAAHAARSGTPVRPTLDVQQNPRWGGRNTLEVPAAFDRILLRGMYPKPMPRLERVALFGTRAYGHTGLAASDHYGLCAEIDFAGGTGWGDA